MSQRQHHQHLLFLQVVKGGQWGLFWFSISDTWFYLETALEGGRVLTTLAGDRFWQLSLCFLSSPGGNGGFDVKHFLFRYCNMQGKHENDDHQLWRLKVDNSLRVVSGFQTVSHMCRGQPDPILHIVCKLFHRQTVVWPTNITLIAVLRLREFTRWENTLTWVLV